MKKEAFFVICFLFVLLSLPVFAQSQEKTAAELRKAPVRQQALSLQLDSAILLSHQEKYQQAEDKFLYVLKNMRSIPADLTFHFGLNSYYLKKYKQSIDWLNKYIQLKGTTGQYSEQAAHWLELSQKELLRQQEEDRLKNGAAEVVVSNDFEIDCGPSGKITCPVCDGTTVIVKKGYFGDNYKTCGFCARKGYLSCADYNRLLRGELKPATQ